MNVLRNACRFRIASLNIHFFTDVNGESNVHRLAQLLKPLSLDAVALQETLHTNRPIGQAPERYYHFKLLSELLQFPYTAFCNTTAEFGNALLSPFPLTNHVNYYVEAIGERNKRGMLAAQIEHEFFRDNDATLYVTHLDQISEEIRLKQIESFEGNIRQPNGFQLIMGDFNALTFDDYSSEYFNTHIRDVRQQNSWEEPFNLVTQKMKEYGFIDCWREMNQDAKDDQAVTCVYKTRIDYIWKRGELKKSWTIDECRIFPTDETTDHNGVLLTLIKTNV